MTVSTACYQWCQHDGVQSWLPVVSAQLSKMLVTSDVSTTVSSAGYSGVSMMGPENSYQWCQHSWARKPVIDAGTFKYNVF